LHAVTFEWQLISLYGCLCWFHILKAMFLCFFYVLDSILTTSVQHKGGGNFWHAAAGNALAGVWVGSAGGGDTEHSSSREHTNPRKCERMVFADASQESGQGLMISYLLHLITDCRVQRWAENKTTTASSMRSVTYPEIQEHVYNLVNLSLVLFSRNSWRWKLLLDDNLYFMGTQIHDMPMNVSEACFCRIFCETGCFCSILTGCKLDFEIV
jgi:hypothetical protein